jgi:predicted DNA-binding transcriptional regulator AlpA
LPDSQTNTFELSPHGTRKIRWATIEKYQLVTYSRKQFEKLGKEGKAPMSVKIREGGTSVGWLEWQLYAWTHHADDWEKFAVDPGKNADETYIAEKADIIPESNANASAESKPESNANASAESKPEATSKPASKPDLSPANSSDDHSASPKDFYTWFSLILAFFLGRPSRFVKYVWNKMDQDPMFRAFIMIMLVFIILAYFIVRLGFRIQ